MYLKFVTLASGINFVILAIALLLKKTSHKKSNYILFTLFVFMALYSSIVFLHYSAIENKNYLILAHYMPFDGIALLAMGPCLYFYILSLLQKPIVVFSPKGLLHLIPFIPYIAFNVYFATLSVQNRTDWLIRDFNVGTFETNVLNLMLYTQITLYLIVCYRMVTKQLKINSGNEFNNIPYDISWLKTYLIINLGFMIVSSPICFYFANEQANIIIGQLAMDIQFIYMFFKWTLHTENSPTVQTPAFINKKKYSNADNLFIQKHLEVLRSYIESVKPYLDENCNLQQVSEETGIPEHQLSIVLNLGLQKTFPDFINEYRIQKAKEILQTTGSTRTLTLEHIASECGFGSKSTFNRAFKKFSNHQTPTEFIRQHKNSPLA